MVGSPLNQAYYPLNLLNHYIGGPMMMSRLNLAVREKYGLTYIIESKPEFYSNSGVFKYLLWNRCSPRGQSIEYYPGGDPTDKGK